MPYANFRLLLFLGLIGSAIASQQGDLSLSGRVTNEVTGAPIVRALVHLRGYSDGKTTFYKAFTDGSGNFRFDGLPKGEFWVQPIKPRFQWNSSKQANGKVELAASRDSLVFFLRPLSSIEGRVVDSAGRPLQGVQIKMYSNRVSEGRRRLKALRTTSTDDRGIYRMWDLEPNKVYVKAMGRIGGTVLYQSEQAPSFVGYESFQPSYHDGVESAGLSNPVDLKPGQESRVDFRLPLQPAYKIRGVVKNLEASKAAKFELLKGNEDITASRATLNIVNGRFEVRDVLPGSYRLRMEQGEGEEKQVAETSVEISNGNLENIELFAFRGIDLRVEIEIQPLTETTPSIGEDTRFYVRPCSVKITANTFPHEVQYASTNEPKGELKIKGVMPGEYDVSAECSNAFVAGIALGTMDLTQSKKLIVRGGSPPEVLSIRALRNGGSIEVAYENMVDLVGMRLLIVPAVDNGDGPTLLPATYKGIPKVFAPGDYMIYLLESVDFPYLEAAEIRKLKNGKSIRVNAGELTSTRIQEVSR